MRSVFISYASADDRNFSDSLGKFLESSGFNLFDGLEQRNRSPESVLAAIRRADIVLGLVHNYHPNVLLELGFAIGTGKPILLIMDPAEELPSELAGFQTIRAAQVNRDLVLEVMRRIEHLGIPADKSDTGQESATELLKTFYSDPERFKSIDPRMFEELVAEIYRGLGFNVILSSGSRDRGVDLIISDTDGPIAVQCKRQSTHKMAAIHEIRELIGATILTGAIKGIFVTTSKFTKAARDLVERSSVEIELVTIENLIDQAVHRQEEAWHASELLLTALKNVQKDARERNLGISRPLLSFQVLDYCGVLADPKHRSQIDDAVRSALRSLPASPLIKLPDGIEGVLVSLGDKDSGIYMVLVDSDIDLSRRKIVAHELEHIASRLRSASDASGNDAFHTDV